MGLRWLQWRGNYFYIGGAGADQDRYLKSSKLYYKQKVGGMYVRSIGSAVSARPQCN